MLERQHGLGRQGVKSHFKAVISYAGGVSQEPLEGGASIFSR